MTMYSRNETRAYLMTCDSCGSVSICDEVSPPPEDYEIAGLYEEPNGSYLARPASFVVCAPCTPYDAAEWKRFYDTLRPAQSASA